MVGTDHETLLLS